MSTTTKNGLNGSPRKRARTDLETKVTVVLGAQWGDEGKGKVVDMLATDVDVVCRCQVHIFRFFIKYFWQIAHSKI